MSSNHEKSLDGPNNDPRQFGTVDDQATLSQDQWISMRGGRGTVGAGAHGAICTSFERDGDFDLEKTSGGFSHIGRGFSEAEKRQIITSAVRGAETAEEMAGVKHLERVLDRGGELKDRPYTDCFGDIYERLQAEKENRKEEFHGKLGADIGRGAIGEELSDGGGLIAHRIGDAARDALHDLSGIGSGADLGGGLAGHELSGRDEGIYLSYADNGGRQIGIVPANNSFYSDR